MTLFDDIFSYEYSYIIVAALLNYIQEKFFWLPHKYVLSEKRFLKSQFLKLDKCGMITYLLLK